jgi:hypothetical protein
MRPWRRWLMGSHTIECGIQMGFERLPLRMIYAETRGCRQAAQPTATLKRPSREIVAQGGAWRRASFLRISACDC